MSTADGEINIQVKADGVEDAAAEVADQEGGGGGMPGGGGGSLRGNLKAGAIAGVLLSALGPVLDLLSPMLKILQAFLAPLAAMLLRILQPVLRYLIRLLPAWMQFIDELPKHVANAVSWIQSLPGRIWGFVQALPGMTWRAIKSGAGWLANGASAIGTAIWNTISGWATTLKDSIVGLAADVGSKVWSSISNWASGLRDDISNLPGQIWGYMKQLAGMIAEKIPDPGDVPGSDLAGDVWGATGGRLFAEGGIVTEPTPGIVGEAGNEAVIPLDRFERMLDQQGGGGGTQIQLSGGLGAFVDRVEKDSGVDIQ